MEPMGTDSRNPKKDAETSETRLGSVVLWIAASKGMIYGWLSKLCPFMGP